MTVMPMMPMPATPSAAMPDGVAVPVDAEGSFAALFAAVLGQSEVPTTTPQGNESVENVENVENVEQPEVTVEAVTGEPTPTVETTVEEEEPPAEALSRVSIVSREYQLARSQVARMRLSRPTSTWVSVNSTVARYSAKPSIYQVG